MTEATQGRRQERIPRLEGVLYRLLLLAIVAVNVVLVLQSDFLPMMDASSHLATAHAFVEIVRGEPFYIEHYEFQPVPLPYWITTLVLAPLLLVFDPLTAQSICVASFVVLLPLSFLVLARRLNPSCAVLAPILALGVFQKAYWYGETPYLLSEPFSLLALGVFLGLDRVASGRFALFCVLSILTYASHVFGLATLAGSIGLLLALSIVSSASGRLAGCRFTPGQYGGAALVGLLFVLASWLVLFRYGGESHSGSPVFEPALWRLYGSWTDLLAPWSASASARIALAAMVLVVAVALVLPHLVRVPWLGWRPALEAAVEPRALALALSFGGLYVFGPVALLDEHGVGEKELHMRMAYAAVAFGLCVFRYRPPRAGHALVLAALAAFALVKLQDSWSIHRDADRRTREFVDAVLSNVPPHSRVVGLMVVGGEVSREDWVDYQLVNYVVPLRDGYSPRVFARAGQQPLRHRYWGEHRDMARLGLTPEEEDFYEFALVQMVGPGIQTLDLPRDAKLVGRLGEFSLYRLGEAEPE